MSNSLYNQFYMRYGIRSIGRLTNPTAFNLERFMLPRGTIIHYIPKNILDLGPESTFFPLQAERQRPYIDNVTEMARKNGNPRRKGAFNVEGIKREWLNKHRGFRRMSDPARALDDKQIAIVANYGLIGMQWKYPPLPLTRYWKFQNLLSTVYERAKYYASLSDRQQFIFVPVPDNLPGRMQLNVSVESMEDIEYVTAYRRAFENEASSNTQTFGDALEIAYPGLTQHLPEEISNEAFDEGSLGWGEGTSIASFEELNRIRLGYFTDDDSLFIQDIWQWMSGKRSESLLSIIPEDQLHKINFVFTRMGKFSLLNLGYLNKWTLSEENPKGEPFSAISKKVLSHLTGMIEITGDLGKNLLEETPGNYDGVNEVVDVIEVESTELPPKEEAPVEEYVDNTPDDDGDIFPDIELPKEEERPRFNVNTNKRTDDRKPAINLRSFMGESNETGLRLAVAPPEEPVEVEIEPPVEMEVVDPLVEGVRTRAEDLLNKGLISKAEYNRHIRQANSYKRIIAPFNEEQTLEEFSKIPRELVWDFKPTEINDIPHVKDKSMLKSTLISYDQRYIDDVMQKDVLNFVLNLQKAGIAVTDFRVERQVDALNDLYSYSIKVSPIPGQPSVIRFQLPVIDKDGKYVVAGTKYYMRKLRFDKPIRKISASTVALSTYYGKLFVERSARASDDYGEWLKGLLTAATLTNPPIVTDVVYGNTFADSQPVPRAYSALSTDVSSFSAAGIEFIFDYSNIEKNFPGYKGAHTPVGRRGKVVVEMNKEGQLILGSQNLGDIGLILGGTLAKKPDETVSISVLGQSFPLGIVLLYLKGVAGLLDMLEVKPQRRIKGSRVEADPNSFDIVFADEIWRIPRIRHADTLIYSSLNLWKKELRNFSISELDSQDSYNALLSSVGLSGRYLLEFKNLRDLFIDPVAEENLREMGEPTEFIQLLWKSSYYLVSDEYPSDLSSEGALFKGYERMTGAVYRSLVEGVRRFSGRSMGSRSVIDIPPFEVLAKIQKDSSVALTEGSNPIHNLKEKENVTYSGTGGRAKRSMVRRTRAFHSSDIGIRSEAGVDNGDVGINCFLTANPNLTSLRGTAVTETDLTPEHGAGNLLSTSALVSPFATYDDPKRVS